jgi:hypothetical protein
LKRISALFTSPLGAFTLNPLPHQLNIQNFNPEISHNPKMDEAIATFTAITGASEDVARRYLGFTEQNAEQAVQLFFDSPDLASGVAEPPSIPTSSRPPPSSRQQDGEDSDNGPMELDDDDNDVAAIARAANTEDDEAMARRLQEEMYGGGGGGGSIGNFGDEGVRAPIERRSETLVGGAQDWGQDDIQAAVLEQMRARQAVGRGGTYSRSTMVTSLKLLTLR